MTTQCFLVFIFVQVTVYQHLHSFGLDYEAMQTYLLQLENDPMLTSRQIQFLGQWKSKPLPRFDYGAYGSYSLALCHVVESHEQEEAFNCPNSEP